VERGQLVQGVFPQYWTRKFDTSKQIYEYRQILTFLKLDCAHGEKGIASLKSAYQALLDADAGLGATNEWLDSEDEILAQMPLLSREQIKGWKAVFSKDGGWLAAAKAINAIGQYLRSQGVNFGFYGAGTFKAPLLAEGVCIGVETVDGTRYYANKIILAAGAWSSALVDLQDQCVSKVRTTDTHHP
jgi:sarcosine oxidase/L-pipecolate oxidase